MERLMTILFYGKQPQKILFLLVLQRIIDHLVEVVQTTLMVWLIFLVEGPLKTVESSQILWHLGLTSIPQNLVKLARRHHHVDGAQIVQKQNTVSWEGQAWQHPLLPVQRHCYSNI